MIRILERFNQYGHIRPGPMERPDVTSLLTKAQLLVLMDYVLSNPTSYYKEMQSYLAEAKGNSPDFIGIHCILKCSGYSRKRVSLLLDMYKNMHVAQLY